jgi:hypothetical protein
MEVQGQGYVDDCQMDALKRSLGRFGLLELHYLSCYLWESAGWCGGNLRTS